MSNDDQVSINSDNSLPAQDNGIVNVIDPTDGRSYDVPASNAGILYAQGFRDETPGETDLRQYKKDNNPANQGYFDSAIGAAKVGFAQAVNQFAFGAPQLAYEKSKGENNFDVQKYEYLKSQHPYANIFGGVAGVIGNIAATAGLGELFEGGKLAAQGLEGASDALESADAVKNAGEASDIASGTGAATSAPPAIEGVTPVTADEAIKPAAPGFISRAISNVPQNALTGVGYAAPQALVKEAYRGYVPPMSEEQIGDPNTLGELYASGFDGNANKPPSTLAQDLAYGALGAGALGITGDVLASTFGKIFPTSADEISQLADKYYVKAFGLRKQDIDPAVKQLLNSKAASTPEEARSIIANTLRGVSDMMSQNGGLPSEEALDEVFKTLSNNKVSSVNVMNEIYDGADRIQASKPSALIDISGLRQDFANDIDRVSRGYNAAPYQASDAAQLKDAYGRLNNQISDAIERNPAMKDELEKQAQDMVQRQGNVSPIINTASDLYEQAKQKVLSQNNMGLAPEALAQLTRDPSINNQINIEYKNLLAQNNLSPSTITFEKAYRDLLAQKASENQVPLTMKDLGILQASLKTEAFPTQNIEGIGPKAQTISPSLKGYQASWGKVSDFRDTMASGLVEGSGDPELNTKLQNAKEVYKIARSLMPAIDSANVRNNYSNNFFSLPNLLTAAAFAGPHAGTALIASKLLSKYGYGQGARTLDNLAALAARGGKLIESAPLATFGAGVAGEAGNAIGPGILKTGLSYFNNPNNPDDENLSKYYQLQNTLSHLATNPDALNTAAQAYTQSLSQFAPKAAQGAKDAMVRGVQYLQTQIPKGAQAPDPTNPYAHVPTSQELGSFQNKLQAVIAPGDVIKEIASGSATRDQLDAFQAVYPNLYSAIQKSYSQAFNSQFFAVRPALRDKIKYLLDGPTNTPQNAARAQVLQQSYQQPRQAPVNQGSAIGAKSGAKFNRSNQVGLPDNNINTGNISR